MPHRDLRHPELGFDPLAPFVVLAIMCHPNSADKLGRDRMLSTNRRGTGEGKVRTSVLEDAEFKTEVDFHARRRSLAGFVLLECLRQHAVDGRVNLEHTVELEMTLPDRWVNTWGFDSNPEAHKTHMPHSRRKVRDAFSHYLPASHLWAAFLHVIQNDRSDAFPDRNEHLPRFLRVCACLCRHGIANSFAGRQQATCFAAGCCLAI